MLMTVVVLLCLNDSCIEKVVTDQATLMQCKGPFAAQAIPGWMAENGYTARGYRLAKWDCVTPAKRKTAT